jgi:ABC-2 type transport system ATP-binding protein
MPREDIPMDLDQYSIYMKDASVEYSKGIRVLSNVTLTAKKGEILGLLGGSGAGKSTVMRVMTGQVKPTDGYAYTAGFNVLTQHKELVEKIGYVPQLEYMSLYFNCNAIENCVFFGQTYGLRPKEIREKAKEVCDILGLRGDLQTKPIKYLSGGQAKRVSMAVGLVNTPEVLFLDEPTTGLDPHLRVEVLNFLLKINRKYGTTMVIVSHDLEVADYCTKVAIIQHGHLVAAGEPSKMIETLPSKGRMIILRFKNLTRQDYTKIAALKGVVYSLVAGRNKLKLWLKDVKDVRHLLGQLMDVNCEPEEFIIDNCTFLEYFRLQGTYGDPVQGL